MPTEGADDGSTTENASLIARWDLDKTYLRTEFDTLGDIVRTALERPDQKRAVPGASVVLRELGQSGARIHIVSGSPRQMKRRLQEKLRIDKVRCDELTLKPNLSNALRLRLRALRDQLGYKLPVLLTARVRDQTRANGDTLVEEALVGDDAEADAFVYSLYADICEGEVSEKDLKRILKRGRVYSDQAERCLEAFPRIANGTVVRRILIHLDRQSQPSKFDPYGPRVVPFYNYLQAAFVLAEDGVLLPSGVLRVAAEFALRHRFEADALARSYLDLFRRRHVEGRLAEGLDAALGELTGGAEKAPAEAQLKEMCAAIRGYVESPPVRARERRKKLDYLELAERHRGGRNRKHRG